VRSFCWGMLLGMLFWRLGNELDTDVGGLRKEDWVLGLFLYV
jgi:hypothetical protein